MNKLLKIFGAIVSTIAILYGVILFCGWHLMSIYRLDNENMNTVVTNGDYLFADKVLHKFSGIKRFDIVLVENPRNNELVAMRVIGLPNERIDYIQSKLYVNNEPLDEAFLPSDVITSYFSTVRLFSDTAGVIPTDSYVLINDNRKKLEDSRTLGAFNKTDIVGVVRGRVYPFDKLGILEQIINKDNL